MTAVLAKHIVGEGGEVCVIEWNEKTAQWARESISRHGFSENDIQVILQMILQSEAEKRVTGLLSS